MPKCQRPVRRGTVPSEWITDLWEMLELVVGNSLIWLKKVITVIWRVSTEQYPILPLISPAFCLGYSQASLPATFGINFTLKSPSNIPTTINTPSRSESSSGRLITALSKPNSLKCPKRYFHKDNSPLNGWYDLNGNGEYRHYVNGEWTDVAIDRIKYVCLSIFPHRVDLPSPSYRVLLFNFGPIAEQATFNKAKKLAESYYKERQKINTTRVENR